MKMLAIERDILELLDETVALMSTFEKGVNQILEKKTDSIESEADIRTYFNLKEIHEKKLIQANIDLICEKVNYLTLNRPNFETVEVEEHHKEANNE